MDCQARSQERPWLPDRHTQPLTSHYKYIHHVNHLISSLHGHKLLPTWPPCVASCGGGVSEYQRKCSGKSFRSMILKGIVNGLVSTVSILRVTT
jgi:hypothetical protein